MRAPHNIGLHVSDNRKVAKFYLKGWFIIDFLASLPLTYVELAMRNDKSVNYSQNLRMLKILRLLRITKILRVARYFRLIGERRLEYLRPGRCHTRRLLLLLHLILPHRCRTPAKRVPRSIRVNAQRTFGELVRCHTLSCAPLRLCLVLGRDWLHPLGGWNSAAGLGYGERLDQQQLRELLAPLS